MRILLLGKNGQVGWELQRSLALLGEVIALGRCDTLWGDFARPAELAAGVRALAPDVIVNAAAYTAVDAAEGDAGTAFMVNASAPQALAQVAAELGAWLVHYSTDYVFDGGGSRPWSESDTPRPLNQYGHSKLAGETNIHAAGCKHLILRTSWVYAARGKNFARTILRLAQEQDTLHVVDDQFGVPTGADLLADITAHALRQALTQPDVSGVYHVAPAGETTWYGYAKHLIENARTASLQLKVTNANIKPIKSHEFPQAISRPANSRLNTTKLRSTFNLHLPPWQAGVDRLLTALLQK